MQLMMTLFCVERHVWKSAFVTKALQYLTLMDQSRTNWGTKIIKTKNKIPDTAGTTTYATVSTRVTKIENGIPGIPSLAKKISKY